MTPRLRLLRSLAVLSALPLLGALGYDVAGAGASGSSTISYSVTLPPPPALSGTVYYVSPSGSDTASGSASAPWRTIQKAVDTAGAGSTIAVRAGTYPERVLMSRSGTSTSPVTLQAYPGERPVITGRLKIDASYVRVVGLTFEGSSLNTDSALLWINGGSGVSVESNELRSALQSCVFGAGPGARIVGNWIHDCGTHLVNGVPQDHGIYWTGADNGLISNNVITDSIGFGIQMHPYSSSNTGNRIVGNTIIFNGRAVTGSQGASGIVIDGSVSSNNVVEDNVLAWNSECGVRSLGTIGSGNVVRGNVGYLDPKGDFPTGYYGAGLSYSSNVVAQPLVSATASYGSTLVSTGSGTSTTTTAGTTTTSVTTTVTTTATTTTVTATTTSATTTTTTSAPATTTTSTTATTTTTSTPKHGNGNGNANGNGHTTREPASAREAYAAGSLPVKAFAYWPARPQRGDRVVARLVLPASVRKLPAAKRHVACRAGVGSTHLTAVKHTFRGALATCVWLVPRNAAGKKLAVAARIRVGVAGVATSRRLWLRIRG